MRLRLSLMPVLGQGQRVGGEQAPSAGAPAQLHPAVHRHAAVVDFSAVGKEIHRRHAAIGVQIAKLAGLAKSR